MKRNSTERRLFSAYDIFIMKCEVNIMNKERKKELLEAYKNRKTEMGIIYFKCIPTQTYFLGISMDTKADLNSITVRLETSWYSNHELMNLWKEYGKVSFEIGVLEVLPYKQDQQDYQKELESLCEEKLKYIENARRLK